MKLPAVSRRNQTQRIRLSDSNKVSLGEWSFGSRQNMGLENSQKHPLHIIRRSMTRIILAPYRGAIAEVLSFFEINPKSFAGLPLDIEKHHEKG